MDHKCSDALKGNTNCKCYKIVKYNPNLMYSKERRPQFKSYKSKHRSPLSKIENKILLHLIERAPPSNHLGTFEYENQ